MVVVFVRLFVSDDFMDFIGIYEINFLFQSLSCLIFSLIFLKSLLKALNL